MARSSGASALTQLCMAALLLSSTVAGVAPIPARTLRLRALATDDQASCDAAAESSAFAEYLTALPATGGIRGCVATNIASLYTALSASDSQCDLTTLTSLFSTNASDADSAAFSSFFGLLLGDLLSSSSSGSTAGSTADLVTSLTTWNDDGAANTAGFCSVMNTEAGPCIDALLPAIIELLADGAACCSTLSEYYEIALLIVPTGQTLEQTVVDLVNGLHRAMCSSASGDLCGQSLTAFLADALTSADTSLLSALLSHVGLPLYAAAEASVCSDLEGTDLASRLDGSTSISYYSASCCASGVSALMESLDAVVTHLTGDSIPELLTLITGRQDLEASSQFASPYSAIGACSFEQTCSAPEFVLTASATTASNSSAAVTAKTATAQNVTCTKTDVCDADDVCSSVCEAGSAIIQPWVARAITYQRNQSYDQTLCYTELPGTHNSVITRARGYGNRDQLFNAVLNVSNTDSYMRTNNQFLSVTDQLNLGARFIEMDVHYFASNFYSAHCSDIGFAFLEDASTSLVAGLESILGGSATVEWQSSLIGCLPSLSGIRAEEQRLHNESLAELAEWIASNPDDLVVLYTEVGTEIEAFSKLDSLLTMYSDVFGDVLMTPSDLNTFGSSWNDVTLNELIAAGKRVVSVATPEGNDVMAYMLELCNGWDDVSSTSNTVETNAGTIVRAYHSELHYASLSESGLLDSGSDGSSSSSASENSGVDASTLPTFVAQGVNILAPDGLDGLTVAAMVWSWAANEPSDGDAAVMVSAADGRWYGVASASDIDYIACVSSSNRTLWEVVGQGSDCPSGYSFDAPRLAVENTALLQVLQDGSTAQLDVDLSNFPAISAEDQAAYDAGDSNTSGSSPAASGDGGSGGSNRASSVPGTGAWTMTVVFATVVALSLAG